VGDATPDRLRRLSRVDGEVDAARNRLQAFSKVPEVLHVMGQAPCRGEVRRKRRSLVRSLNHPFTRPSLVCAQGTPSHRPPPTITPSSWPSSTAPPLPLRLVMVLRSLHGSPAIAAMASWAVWVSWYLLALSDEIWHYRPIGPRTHARWSSTTPEPAFQLRAGTLDAVVT
jgi:hypothetical protein